MVSTKPLLARCSTHKSVVAQEIMILTHSQEVFNLNTGQKRRLHKLFCYPQQTRETREC